MNRAFLDQRRANELVNTFLTLLPLFDTYYHPFCDRKDRQRNRNNDTSRDLFTWNSLPSFYTLIELNWWACDWQQTCHQSKKNVSYLYGICLIGKCVECINITNVSHFGPQTRNNQKCYSIKSYSSRKKEFIVLSSANLITGIQEKIVEAKSSFRNN